MRHGDGQTFMFTFLVLGEGMLFAISLIEIFSSTYSTTS